MHYTGTVLEGAEFDSSVKRGRPFTFPLGGGRVIKGSNAPNMAAGGVGKEVKGRTHTYYQVLIDGRDSPYITHRAQTESVTFLGNHSV